MWDGLVGAIIGAVLGAGATAFISWRLFRQQNRIDRYLQFVDDIEAAWKLYKKIVPGSNVAPETGAEIIHHLNRAYFKAMIAMDDVLFLNVGKLLNGAFSKEKRNRLYHLMRKSIFRRTRITFEDVVDKDFGLSDQQKVT